MKRAHLLNLIHTRKSFLCVGLDTDIDKLPPHFPKTAESVLTFNKAIIDATKSYCVAYKPNFAFYESLGAEGWEVLKATVEYIGHDHLTIADAKRGDIGNTATQYAKAIFDHLNFDAVTIAPYMGGDSVRPFLDYRDKWTIVLGLTSNPGHQDIQMQQLYSGKYVYQHTVETMMTLGAPDQLMFVVGATRGESLTTFRSMTKDYFWLVPGVGAQGGSLKDVWTYGQSQEVGLIVNSSRGIIFAGQGEDFAHSAQQAASQLQKEMASYLTKADL